MPFRPPRETHVAVGDRFLEHRTTLQVSPDDVLAAGGGTQVFYHPENEGVLLKVFKPKRVTFKKKVTRILRPSKRRFGMYREWFAEHDEYIATINKMGRCPDFLPRFLGFTNTSLGPASMVENVHDAGSNALSQTLRDFIGTQDVELVKPLVDAFFDEIAEHRVVFRDLHPGNLCVVRDEQKVPVRIVCIDGLGDFTMVRLRRYSKAAYRSWHTRVHARLLGELLGH